MEIMTGVCPYDSVGTSVSIHRRSDRDCGKVAPLAFVGGQRGRRPPTALRRGCEHLTSRCVLTRGLFPSAAC